MGQVKKHRDLLKIKWKKKLPTTIVDLQIKFIIEQYYYLKNEQKYESEWRGGYRHWEVPVNGTGEAHLPCFTTMKNSSLFMQAQACIKQTILTSCPS